MGKDKKILYDVKVADFSRGAALPYVTKYLADYGATVVRVESMTNPDISRTISPFAGDKKGIDRSGFFAKFNNNKYSMSLNLDHPRGLEVAKRLVVWSNVVVENFRPGVMEKWGLAYKDIVKTNSDVIMLSSSMHGQTGPHANRVGLGMMLAGLAGYSYYIGWPDRQPSGSSAAWTDEIAAWYATIALLGAIEYRRRTGKGQYIEQSQLEASLSFFSPAILDYTANGRIQERLGNSCPYAAPHGAYRCKGEDRWCAIAAFTDQDWQTFCKIIGEPDWTKKPQFSTLLGRKKNEAELNKFVEQWTVNYAAEEVMQMMQQAGIAAGVVQNGRDLSEDSQLKYRGFFWNLPQPGMGMMSYRGSAFILSKTPGYTHMPAPRLGEHTEYVCCKFLGMSDDEFVKLMDEGVFE